MKNPKYFDFMQFYPMPQVVFTKVEALVSPTVISCPEVEQQPGITFCLIVKITRSEIYLSVSKMFSERSLVLDLEALRLIKKIYS